jgi:hypothetical protein
MVLTCFVSASPQLADKKWGVIPIKYRKVDCSYQPSNKAWNDNPFPGVFPSVEDAKQKSWFDFYSYFPNGGYTNRKDGGSHKISTNDFMSKIGRGK